MGVTGVYNHGKFAIGRAQVDLANADIRVLLVNSGYVFAPTHNFVSDITFELGGTGYVRKILANKTAVEDDIGNLVKFDADDLTWTGANFTGSGGGGGTPDAAIIYVESGSDMARNLLFCLDISPKIVPSGVDYTLQFGAAGILLF